MHAPTSRRRLLLGAGAALAISSLPGASLARARGAGLGLRPIPISLDRITGVTVCTRPFRATGPRLEVERIGQQDVVHHYGHGGSGWSLSWGSGEMAAALALGTGQRDIGVIGCGAIGLTTALRRAGRRTVTIYARERPGCAFVLGRAAGLGLALCLESEATPAFRERWQRMTRRSWHLHQGMLGLAGEPVGFVDAYSLSDKPPTASGEPEDATAPNDGRPRFARLARELVPEISFAAVAIDPSATPFVAPSCGVAAPDLRSACRVLLGVPLLAGAWCRRVPVACRFRATAAQDTGECDRIWRPRVAGR